VTAVRFPHRSTTGRVRARRPSPVLLLVGSLALALAACGVSGSDLSSKDGQPSVATSTTKAATTSTLSTTVSTTVPNPSNSPDPMGALLLTSRQVLLNDGDIAGYTLTGAMRTSSDEAPTVQCFEGVDAQVLTITSSTGPTLTSPDGSVEVTSASRVFGGPEFAMQVMKSLSRQGSADCFGQAMAASLKGQGSFKAAPAAEELKAGDEVESMSGTFTGATFHGATTDVRAAMVAVRTGGVITILSMTAAPGGTDPAPALQAAAQAVATHQKG
jgi:hypothetical protein